MQEHNLRHPAGYSRVLILLAVAVAFTLWLVATGFVVAAGELTIRSVDPVRALNAADSGIERALYLSAVSSSPPANFESHEAPFIEPNYFYRVAIERNLATTVTAVGVSGTTERVVQVRY